MKNSKTNRILAQSAKKEDSERSLARSNRPDIVEKYLSDESAIFKGKAEEVVFPETETQIAKLLNEANSKKIPVTVSGAGTGITGSRVPFGGIVLSTERLAKVPKRDSMSPTIFKDPVGGVEYELYIAKNEHYAIAPPSISIENLQKVVEKNGLLYPVDPTEKTAFLGGTVATNASGAKTFHYGPTRNWIRRVRVALPNGDLLDIRRGEVFSNDQNEFEIVLSSGEQIRLQTPLYKMPNVKNAAGYHAMKQMDLIDLFIGCEGTLGAFTEIEVSLIDRPEKIFDCLAYFVTTNDAMRFCDEARQIAKSKEERKGEFDLVAPLSLEFFDRCSLEIQRAKHPDIPAKAKAAILFEQAIKEEKLYDCLSQWNTLFERHHVFNSWLPMDQHDREKLTEIRHSLPEGINDYVRLKGTHKVATDIAVPSERFNEMMRFHVEVGLEIQIARVLADLGLQYDSKIFQSLSLPEKVKFVEDRAGISPPAGGAPTNAETQPLEEDHESLADRVDIVRESSKTEVAYAIFGHIGDFHLHFNFLPRSAVELDQMKKASYRLAKKAVELGGTITAEHGVGKKTYVDNGIEKPYLELMYGKQGLESVAAIKNAIDPNWILNRGNVVSVEYFKH